MDSDDAITESAMNELYSIADSFNADVVDCESFYNVNNKFWNVRNMNKDILKVKVTYKKVNEPTLLSEDLNERMIDFSNRRFRYPLWTKLIKRDFLIKNELEMINSLSGNEDAVLTCCMLCLAKRYVLIPNTVIFYRVNEKSVSHIQDSVQKIFHIHLDGMSKGFKYLDDFFNNTEFLEQRGDLKFLALDFLLKECFFYLSKFFTQVPQHQLYELIRQELSKVSDKTAFASFLLSRVNSFYLQLRQQGELIQQMNLHIQKQNQALQQYQAKINELQR